MKKHTNRPVVVLSEFPFLNAFSKVEQPMKKKTLRLKVEILLFRTFTRDWNIPIHEFQ